MSHHKHKSLIELVRLWFLTKPEDEIIFVLAALAATIGLGYVIVYLLWTG